jgi:hypothetical protein
VIDVIDRSDDWRSASLMARLHGHSVLQVREMQERKAICTGDGYFGARAQVDGEDVQFSIEDEVDRLVYRHSGLSITSALTSTRNGLDFP